MKEPRPAALLHELFSAQARKSPHSIALLEGDRSITYRELQESVDRLANALGSRGIGSGSMVGLKLDRSIEWVSCVLAILRANAAVVPLAPANPADWFRDVLSFADLDAVIDGASPPLEPALARTVIPFEDLSTTSAEESDGAPGNPEQAAFVLCSSGSTGRPKMIVRNHRSFLHRLNWTWETHPYKEGEVCCQKSHMTTTHAIYELFEPLLAGVPVVIIPDADVRNLDAFWATIRARGVSRLLIVPSALRTSLDMPGFSPPPLEVIVLMGEYVSPRLASDAVASFPGTTRLYSIYGSTEASSTLVCDLRTSIRDGQELPLGTPLQEDIIPLVLGADGEPVGEGDEGRLYMGGPPLFTEYFRSPELTESSLLEIPEQPGPIFDTRDQVRVLAGGGLEFLRRSDQMVKIRGFRVDLPEIERTISREPGVRQAAVAVNETGAGSKTLVAFVVPETVNREELLASLREKLPGPMIPSSLVPLSSFPMTQSGKVDRLRLLELNTEGAGTPTFHRAPSKTETAVAEVWTAALGHTRFGLEDSFFEVGGDSLLVFTLVHGLHDRFGFGTTELAEPDVYSSPTVEELATLIDGFRSGEAARQESPPVLVPLRKGGDPEEPPLFLIASAGGTLGAYSKLTKALRTSRDILGLQDPFIWGQRDPTSGFRTWVDLYLRAIRSRQPHGPYFLCAYSTAGAFGLELARRLRMAGEEVRLLALIDPLALDRSNKGRYGYWALRATYMRPSYRRLVKLWGWLRIPFYRTLGRALGRDPDNDRSFSGEEVEHIVQDARHNQRRVLTFSALMELNSGHPYGLAASDLSGVGATAPLDVLLGRIAELTPDVDLGTIERVAVQYEFQVRTQHAYRLAPYDGRVLLVEPVTKHLGLLEAQLRPYIRQLSTEALELSPPSPRIREISQNLGLLTAHYRSMRDERFVNALAEKLDSLLG